MLSMAAVRLAAIDARQSAGRPNGGFAGGSPRWALRNGTAATNCETFAADEPGFPVLIDRDIGEGGAAGRLK